MEVNLSELWETYMRDGRTYLRKRHNAIHSPRLQAFDSCVGRELRGQRHRKDGAIADERAVRDALRVASRKCSREVPRYGRN